MSKIIYSDYYMPSNTVSVKDILLNSESFLSENSSIDINEAANKYIKDTKLSEITVEKDGNIIDIFSTMISKMFEKINIEPDKIKNIFYTSYKHYDYNNYVSIPYYLQEKYKLYNAAILVLNQHCASTLQAMRIAASLNKSEKGAYSLIISPCFLEGNEDRYMGVTVIGDGASIMLIGDDEYSEGFEIIDTFSISDGYASWYCYDKLFNKSEKNKYNDMKIRLITFESLRKVIGKSVEKYGAWFNDSKFIIGQSISEKIVKGYLKNVEKVYQNYYGGHIEDVDTTRNLKDVMDSVKFKKGDKISLVALGGDFKSLNITSVFCQYE